MLVIAIGWKEAVPALKSTPRVLYCGADVDEAEKAIQKAGKDRQIVSGQIYRGIEDRAIRRLVFDS